MSRTTLLIVGSKPLKIQKWLWPAPLPTQMSLHIQPPYVYIIIWGIAQPDSKWAGKLG